MHADPLLQPGRRAQVGAEAEHERGAGPAHGARAAADADHAQAVVHREAEAVAVERAQPTVERGHVAHPHLDADAQGQGSREGEGGGARGVEAGELGTDVGTGALGRRGESQRRCAALDLDVQRGQHGGRVDALIEVQHEHRVARADPARPGLDQPRRCVDSGRTSIGGRRGAGGVGELDAQVGGVVGRWRGLAGVGAGCLGRGSARAGRGQQREQHGECR